MQLYGDGEFDRGVNVERGNWYGGEFMRLDLDFGRRGLMKFLVEFVDCWVDR